MISNEESFDSHFTCFLFVVFLSRLLSKMSGHHCAYFAFLSKHMARVDCRGYIASHRCMHRSYETVPRDSIV